MTTPQPALDEFTSFSRERVASTDLERHRSFSRLLYARERFVEALWYAEATLAHDAEPPADDVAHAEACAYAAGQHARALVHAEALARRAPNDPSHAIRIGLYHMLLGDLPAAERHYLHARDLAPDQPNTCDALAHLYGVLEKPDEMKRYGNEALRLKDAEATAEPNLAKLRALLGGEPRITTEVPPFNPETPARNVISFSLWGTKPSYLEGAILNAQIASVIYPAWTCRFYCDETVPSQVIAKLRANGADVRVLKKNPLAFFGLFWRFFVADDPEVDRYLVRDCDCLLNVQERVAVDAWIPSNKHFHVMRDYASHTELIHAGMWGGVRGAIPNISALVVDYYDHHGKERTIDQRFLRHYVWPILKQSHLTHDRHYTFGDAQEFPILGRIPRGHGNVGIHWQSMLKRRGPSGGR